MARPNPQVSATPFAFLTVVLSSIGTAAGFLIITASFFFGRGSAPDLPADTFFISVRWFAATLTLLCAAVLAVSLGHFGGHEWARSRRMRTVVFLAGGAAITAFVFTTLR
jgi:hypothetical protein